MAAVNDLLLDAYDRVAGSVPSVLDGLSPEQAAWRPDGEANSVGWLVWHLTRVLDSHLSEARGEEQVLFSQGYDGRLGLDLPAGDTGYGHSSDEVDRVRFEDLGVLADYHRAVQDHAVEYLGGVADLDRVVDEDWDPPVTLSARLVSVLDDICRHVGQAELVAGLARRRA